MIFLEKVLTKVDERIHKTVESHQPEKRFQLLVDPVAKQDVQRVNVRSLEWVGR